MFAQQGHYIATVKQLECLLGDARLCDFANYSIYSYITVEYIELFVNHLCLFKCFA